MVGQSVVAIRLVPALAGALTVFLVGAMARDLEGGPFAMALAMVAVIVSPFYLFMGAYYSMNSLDVLCWAIAAWIILRILSGGSPRLWILLGVVLGIGLENKISVLWLEGGLAVGLLLTPERRLLWTRGPWLAGLISLVLAAPYAVWQFSHNFATLHFMKDAAENRVVVGPLSFFGAVIDGMSAVAAPVWIAGLVFFLDPACRTRPAGDGLGLAGDHGRARVQRRRQGVLRRRGISVASRRGRRRDRTLAEDEQRGRGES
jgi:4-amino-4-deoxy-L-arabinose transferase-like glycosyltransferase